MKIVHLISTINNNGGIQRILFNYLPYIQSETVNNSFVVHGKANSALADEYKKLGCTIYPIKPRKEARSFSDYLRCLGNVLKGLDYDILHIHLGFKSAFALYLSKKYHPNSKVIVHIHSNMKQLSFAISFTKKILTFYIKRKADAFFACGEDSARWFYGDSFCKKNGVFIMRNAISVDKFVFSPDDRRSIRNEFSIDKSTTVIGHVGTFYKPKNHEFLVNVFYSYLKMNNNAVLMLVGGGELENKIKKQVEELGIQNKVLFVGVREDVFRYLSCFDFFVLPSIYEGVPVSIVEAQCSGLNCFISSNVTKEIDETGLCHFLDLKKGSFYWAKEILDFKHNEDRQLVSEKMKGSKFDIYFASGELLSKYDKILTGGHLNGIKN